MKSWLKSKPNFFTHEVAFYLDGVSFVHKHNPMNSATNSKSRVWRKKNEGLLYTSKGAKNLAGGRRLHVFAAIAYGKGCVLWEPYETLNGAFFAEFIRKHFNICFARCGPKDGGRRLFVMDNDPSQTSKVAKRALDEVEAEFQEIPARSPDLNPIENIFNVIKTDLENQAHQLQITSETFKQFQQRVLNTLQNVSVDVVNRTIESMPRRINAVIASKGHRTKY